MQLFYYKEIEPSTENFFFGKDESKYIIKVLRKKDNDTLFVTNGLGFLFNTQITHASETKCCVKIISYTDPVAPQYNLHLAVAPTKITDRFEWFLEKATEIGVSEITPLISHYSESKKMKTDRLEKIIQSAMKQSNQLYLPKLNNPVTFENFVLQNIEGQKFIAHCKTTNIKFLKNELVSKQNYTILIGPEGDFSETEIDLGLSNNFIEVKLGNTRLRTETAAIVACNLISFVN